MKDVRLVAQRSQSIDCAWQGELRGAQTLDEIAASDLTAFFEHLEHAIHGRESANNPLTSHGFAGEHTVTFEQLKCKRVSGLRGKRRRAQQRGHQAPTTNPRWRPETREPTGARALPAGWFGRPR